MSHDHFGNLRRTSGMTKENYEKSTKKRRSYRKSIDFVDFLESSRCRVVSVILSTVTCTCKDFKK